MRVFVILLVLFIIVVSSSMSAFAQSQTKCHFGDSDTPNSEIFTQDVAVNTFVEKYPNSNRTNTIHSSDPFDATLNYKAETEDEEITLTIDYRQNENGCYRPKNYQYSYNDGTMDVTVRNSLSSFTEIINMIKSDDKTLRDFYPDDCSFVDLEYSLSNGIVYGICNAIDDPTITIQAKAYSDDMLEVNIPIETVYSLPSSDCVPSNDFFVFTASGEKPYEITPTDIGNLVTVELEEGANRITISGGWIIPDPSPAQYCGIVDGYDKKYLPPLAQLDHDMKPTAIKCNEELVLIQKYDDTPACVTESTKQKLVERGWTTKDSSAQKIIERIKQDAQAVNEVDARYVETLALMNQTVSNFVYGVEWTSHCCGYSENNNSSEITITFLDSDNQKQLGVTFDLDTMQITDIQQNNTVSIGKGLSSEPDPYRLIALREFPNESSYYHKINNISEIPYISKINENKTTITTSEQFNELLGWFPQKCLENNSDSYDCSNTPPIFEYDSTKYLIVSHGLDSNEVYCESGLLYITDYEKEFPDRNVEDFVPVKCVTPPTKEHLFDK